MIKKSKNDVTASQFDRMFDKQDMSAYLDESKIKVNKKMQRINIDMPVTMVGAIDKEAVKIGVTRTALIKMWLAEKTHLK